MVRKISNAKLIAVFVTCLSIFVPILIDANAPKIHLMRVDGVIQSMTDYIGQGKWVVVNVWSPTCTACVKELPQVQRFEKKYRGEVLVLGVTIDFPSFEYGKIDIIKNFLKKYPLNYPIFLADLESASDVIGNRLVGIPLTAIYHPDGRVLARWPGSIDINEIEEFMENYSDYLLDDDLTKDF